MRRDAEIFMNKVLIKICVPAIRDGFDMFVPVDVPIQDICRVMVNGVVELTNGGYLASGSEHLCLPEPSGLLNPDLTFQDYGIQDGMKLYLI